MNQKWFFTPRQLVLGDHLSFFISQKWSTLSFPTPPLIRPLLEASIRAPFLSLRCHHRWTIGTPFRRGPPALFTVSTGAIPRDESLWALIHLRLPVNKKFYLPFSSFPSYNSKHTKRDGGNLTQQGSSAKLSLGRQARLGLCNCFKSLWGIRDRNFGPPATVITIYERSSLLRASYALGNSWSHQ